MSGWFLSLLRMFRRCEYEEINAIRLAYPEYSVRWHSGHWCAYDRNGTGEAVSGKDAAALRTAICEAWIATGSAR